MADFTPDRPWARRERHIAVVGGGPRAVYAIGHLAAVLSTVTLEAPLRISLFDRSRAGAGEVHDDRQAPTSYMNRAAAQIAFAADESHRGLRALLPRHLRPTFHEWARQRYADTGDPHFDLRPYDVPRRYLHGLALREMFQRYVDRLAALPGVAVDVYAAEVTDLEATGSDDPPFLVNAGGRTYPADHVLFATGHSHNRPRTRAPGIVPDPYPLDERLTAVVVPPGAQLGLDGLGLTAIDVILHVTEGRGGRFEADAATGALRYVRSGREPASIVAVSPSGVPVAGRAVNHKSVDPDRLQHRAVFFTVPAVRRLRACADVLVTDPGGRLEFDRHVLPLVMLEMAYVYYRTLLGAGFADEIRTAVEDRYQRFLSGAGPWGPAGADHLLEPVEAAFTRAAGRIDEPGPRRDAFLQVVYGPPQAEQPPEFDSAAATAGGSPWGHSSEIRDHRFDWREVLDPMAQDASRNEGWSRGVLAFLRRDLCFSAQGNVANPLKAACDGVWRDLRREFAAVVDRGGLRPDSLRRFVRVHLRYYNRLSNGAGLEPMRKIVALTECGLLDLGVGPAPEIRLRPGGGARLSGPVTGVEREVSVLVHARVHPFDPAQDANPLYANLIRRGIVRQWRSAGSAGEPDFLPGALDLDEAYHPIDPSGGVDPRLTFLGAPAEGLKVFELSLARPCSDSDVINGAARWAEDVVCAIVDQVSSGSGRVTAASPRLLETPS